MSRRPVTKFRTGETVYLKVAKAPLPRGHPVKVEVVHTKGLNTRAPATSTSLVSYSVSYEAPVQYTVPALGSLINRHKLEVSGVNPDKTFYSTNGTAKLLIPYDVTYNFGNRSYTVTVAAGTLVTVKSRGSEGGQRFPTHPKQAVYNFQCDVVHTKIERHNLSAGLEHSEISATPV
ncbi:unnamed protein product [Somion occarium]|uniref:Uncharacterized protein n=1 Tax=Somion occarium TaxID=3059160 RepID=A0ABP1CRS5_9APHY